jgi:hypothetical protein
VTEHPGEQFPPAVDPDVEPGFDPQPDEESPPDYDSEPEPESQHAVTPRPGAWIKPNPGPPTPSFKPGPPTRYPVPRPGPGEVVRSSPYQAPPSGSQEATGSQEEAGQSEYREEGAHPLVEETMSRLDELRDRPVADHAEVYADLHERLQSALVEADAEDRG